MKRLTPMLTLLAGTGLAAVLFTMSAQAAPPAARSTPDTGAAAAARPPAAAPPPGVPEPSVQRPGGTPPTEAEPEPDAQPASPAPPTATDAPAATVDVTWTGRLSGGATIAVTVTNGNATAYVCDGRSLEIWLQGTAVDGELALTGKDGVRLTGTFRAGKASGELVVAGRRQTFTATSNGSTAPAVYRAAPQVRDAGVDGGWILLADGSQIGVVTWNGRPVPAPPLDPAFFTTVVDGVTIDAVPVGAAPGDGE
ncbi:hypothetical protein AWW66_30735 [Micromonospora rosaria]|uniref:Uncharacterized protein n=1 Tax=Micromonospora rosaria TaxID=47874 RepID=A0A136PIT7_9ACTN|nr:hypothetical protein [Micromonospora rosaria]KXK58271.1 hypothetical protein AWW66_30735 [Micromonospora rosaria]